jgi:hypothetical protein
MRVALLTAAQLPAGRVTAAAIADRRVHLEPTAVALLALELAAGTSVADLPEVDMLADSVAAAMQVAAVDMVAADTGKFRR